MFWSNDQTKESSASMSADFAGVTLRGIAKLTFTDEVAKEPIYGNSSVSIGVPAGQHKAEGSLQVIVQEADNIITGLGPNYTQIPGTIGVSLYEPFGAGILTYDLTRVYLMKAEYDFGDAGGQKPVMVTFSFIALDPIVQNGNVSVTDQQAGGLILSLPTFSIGL